MSVLTGFRAELGRRVRRYLRPGPVAVCEWNAWDKFLIQLLRPDAARISVSPGERGARVLDAITRTVQVMLVHVDVSHTVGFLERDAELFDGLATRGVIVLNAHATDTRKRTLHQRCATFGIPSAAATRDGPADDQLIIKSTLNMGGAPERLLLARGGLAGARLGRELCASLHDPDQYRLCRRADVPDAVWLDPALVVEHYFDNPEGIFYRVTRVGPATVISEVWSDDVIKKLSLPWRHRVDHFFWTIAGEHTALGDANEGVVRANAIAWRAAAALQVDFHATDCVMDGDGAVYPIDVNKTPYWGTTVRPGVIEHLRVGLECLVKGGEHGRSAPERGAGQ